jgi:glutamate-1-semialdehyde 2,1-aminomutase
VKVSVNMQDAKLTRERSLAAFERAQRLMPGGVNSPARAFGAVGGQPVFIARGEGPYLHDLDGNRYLDYVGSWGPLIWATHPGSSRRSRRQARATYGAPCRPEIEPPKVVELTSNRCASSPRAPRPS